MFRLHHGTLEDATIYLRQVNQQRGCRRRPREFARSRPVEPVSTQARRPHAAHHALGPTNPHRTETDPDLVGRRGLEPLTPSASSAPGAFTVPHFRSTCRRWTGPVDRSTPQWFNFYFVVIVILDTSDRRHLGAGERSAPVERSQGGVDERTEIDRCLGRFTCHAPAGLVDDLRGAAVSRSPPRIPRGQRALPPDDGTILANCSRSSTRTARGPTEGTRERGTSTGGWPRWTATEWRQSSSTRGTHDHAVDADVPKVSPVRRRGGEHAHTTAGPQRRSDRLRPSGGMRETRPATKHARGCLFRYMQHRRR